MFATFYVCRAFIFWGQKYIRPDDRQSQTLRVLREPIVCIKALGVCYHVIRGALINPPPVAELHRVSVSAGDHSIMEESRAVRFVLKPLHKLLLLTTR